MGTIFIYTLLKNPGKKIKKKKKLKLLYVFASFSIFPKTGPEDQISLWWVPENCPISLTRWNFVVPKAAYKTWSVSCQPFLKKRGTVKTLSTIDVDCSISAYCPHFTDGNAKQSYLPWGLFFINNQNNNTICSKSLIYNIKLPPPKWLQLFTVI